MKVSDDNMLDAHHIPFQLMGGKPENVGLLCYIEKVAKVFVLNELTSLQELFREMNNWIGEDVIHFDKYTFHAE